jgi:3-hydroxymyristoyl/3-hydroxydecanoyl-(acyl carrier protein) dehydratase
MTSEETIGAADIHDILQQLGYFPNDPVMLGVLMIEGTTETACVLVQRVLPPPEPYKRRGIFLTIDKAKFRKPARPGTRLRITPIRSRAGAICGGIARGRRSATSSSPRQSLGAYMSEE